MSFYLFETLYGSGDTGLRYLDRHLSRLAASAQTLGFSCDLDGIRNEALCSDEALVHAGPYRLRISLERSGVFEIQRYPLQPIPSGPVKLLLGSDWEFASQSSSNLLLRHKTSLRDEYDRGWKLAETKGAFDMLFVNEHGELTEGGRTNLFLYIDNNWWTPPLSSGLLPGIMRGIILQDTRFDAAERTLFPEDLFNAKQILLCNSLRGCMQADLVRS
ncbi:aminotransferase class IV [Granulicella mallensis]|uniref:Para-aminobenzoate synthetase/4-amino-4-deoxychorismate lyase n=1 Tax=Granulicella mallensis TaxID=940614 RepID=A0A7W8ECH0_9BACT|nr:aminotransferase class IV [Granulicella mallensis]MBB5066887.1 para-aminobenzoate synthetase/4-amino-4-deoxychorismate lyase [Granulicella mallensis]